MKRTGIFIIMIAFFSVSLSYSQENYTKNLNGVTKVYIEIGAKIKLMASSGNEMVLSNYGKKDANNERAKGLKAVYAGGTDNTGFGMLIEQEGSVLRIKDLKSWMQRKTLQLSLPKSMDIHIDSGELGSIILNGFSSEIEVNSNVGDITISDVTGPVTAHTETGTIKVDFSTVNQSSPITINSSTGVIDVALPANTKADLELRSTMGTVYTDFELQKPTKDGMKIVGANRKIASKLNNGGVKIVLRSSTGNVYLRKK